MSPSLPRVTGQSTNSLPRHTGTFLESAMGRWPKAQRLRAHRPGVRSLSAHGSLVERSLKGCGKGWLRKGFVKDTRDALARGSKGAGGQLRGCRERGRRGPDTSRGQRYGQQWGHRSSVMVPCLRSATSSAVDGGAAGRARRRATIDRRTTWVGTTRGPRVTVGRIARPTGARGGSPGAF